MLSAVHEGQPVYTYWEGHRLRGRLHLPRLQAALDALADRHEPLRTTLDRIDGALRQVVSRRGRLPLAITDLRHLPAGQREPAALEGTARRIASPFDLRRGPLAKVELIRLADDDAVLLLGVHHAVFDGWSAGIVHRELAQVYEALSQERRPALPELELQYGDFAAWQRESTSHLESHLKWWVDALRDAPTTLDLPTDRPRRAAPSVRGGVVRFQWPEPLAGQLRTLAHAHEATLFMVLLAGFATVLGRMAGQDDFVVGTPAAGRPAPELEDLVGFFVTTLPLRIDLTGEPSFAELLARLRTWCLDAYTHADVPFERLVQAIAPERDGTRPPLVQVLVALQNAPGDGFRLPGVEIEPWPLPEMSVPFELVVQLSQRTDGGLDGTVEYATDLFDRDSVERLLAHAANLLGAAAEDPARPVSRLPLLPNAERNQVLAFGRGPRCDNLLHRPTVVRQVLDVVARRPCARAVIGDGDILTYAELEQRSAQWAAALLSAGVGPGELVGLRLDRCPELIAAVLGVLRAGAGFLPMDIATPRARVAFISEDAGLRALVTHDRGDSPVGVLPIVPACLRPAGREELPDADDSKGIAYCIYTSGSTGVPKGVLVPHTGLVNLVAAQCDMFGIDETSRVLQLASPSFDAFVSEVFTALCAGAELHVPSRPDVLPGQPLLRSIEQRGITCLTLPPSSLACLPQAAVPTVRTLVSAGETLAADLAARWMAPDRQLINAYGPTEATICATGGAVTATGVNSMTASIGKPLPNVDVYVVEHVLEGELSLAAVGVPGELAIGGAGVALGYLNRPDLTAERFITTADAGRIYLTGDLARWRTDGSLEFLGRRDEQVKVRGFRVELGEIEAALMAAAGVVDTAVTLSSQELVAYVTGTANVPELRAHLRATVPEHLVPTWFVHLDALPRMVNGKIDRAALPRRTLRSPPDRRVQPRNRTEAAVAEAWSEVLEGVAVDVHEKFFDAGGTSLRMVELAEQLELRWPGLVGVADLFEHPTVEEIAALIGRRLGSVPSVSAELLAVEL